MLRFFAIFLLSALPALSLAIGLGEIKLYSYLEEPLDAELELLEAENVDRDTLSIGLASKYEFRQAGLEYPVFLSKLHFELIQKNAKSLIKITSEEPILKSYVEVLLEVKQAGSKVVHGYTLLLDPLPPGMLPLHERRKVYSSSLASLQAVGREGSRSSSQSDLKPASHAGSLHSHNTSGNTRGEEDSRGRNNKKDPVTVHYPMTMVSTLTPSELKAMRESDQKMVNQTNHGEHLKNVNNPNNTNNAHTVNNLSGTQRINQNTRSRPDVVKSHPLNRSNTLNAEQGEFPLDSNVLLIALWITGGLLIIVLLLMMFRKREKEIVEMYEPLFIAPSISAPTPAKIHESKINDSTLYGTKLQEVTSQLERLREHATPPEAVNVTQLNDSSGEPLDDSLNNSLSNSLDISEDTFSSIEHAISEFNSEMSLKLNLACRYLNIRDKENAASLLTDVMVQGNANERALAEKMLAGMHQG